MDPTVVVRQTSSGDPTTRRAPSTHNDRVAAAVLFVVVFALYNANGREIGSYDTKAAELAARELLLRGTLALDVPVSATPEYGARWGIIRARDGHFRGIYSPLPSLESAALTWPFWRMNAVDITAPFAPALMAKVTASTIVAAAVVLSFFVGRQSASVRTAWLIAAGLGLGTGYWYAASQTLWQTETALAGLTLAVLGLGRADRTAAAVTALTIGCGLSLAGVARPQLAPVIVVLLAATCARTSRRAAAGATVMIAAAGAALAVFNVRWFGNPAGALPLLTNANAAIHATSATFAPSVEGVLGLLLSPNRGILVFSPVVALAFAGRLRLRGHQPSVARWCLFAALAQLLLYASYSVWWGGHTFGPRYATDLLPLLVPAAALRLSRPSRGMALLGTTVLVWSVAVAATGAFCYPNDRWNTSPTDVDRDHARLWTIRDNQILRAWHAGASPQNYRLFSYAAVRSPPPRR